MASKWADYCISGVRYDRDDAHIVVVDVREDKGDTIGARAEWTRGQVAVAVERGTTFVTILHNKQTGKWDRGAAVHLVVVHGVKYIRTDRNLTARDNLENLPRI